MTLRKFLTLLFLFVLTNNLIAQNAGIYFDGTDDYVMSDISPIAGNTAKTVEAWIKTTANSNPSAGGVQKVIVEMGLMSTGTRFTFNLLNNNAIRLEVEGNGINGTTAVNDGQWHHVAGVYDPLAITKVALYLDGVLEASGNLTVTVNTAATGNIQIGRRCDGLHYFNGTIDEVRVWNVARTASQIANNRNVELCNSTANLVAYFPMNEGTPGATNTANTSISSYGNTFGTGVLNGFKLSGSTSNFVTGKPLGAGLSVNKINLTKCNAYNWPVTNQTYNTSGTYIGRIAKVNGCDSIIKLNLNITTILRSSITVKACDTFTWALNGQTYGASGSYADTLLSASGCDSIVTLNLTVNPIPPTIQNISACEVYTWPENNQRYTQSTQAFAILKNARGCDSLITLNLTINKKDSADFNVNQCNPYTWSATGITYSKSGAYKAILVTSKGCDSLVTLHLTISPAFRIVQSEIACQSFTWDKNGKVYTTTTTDSVIYKTAANCDSIIVLDVFIINFDITVSNKTTYLEANLAGAEYQWVNCFTRLPIVGATAQTFTPTATGNYKCLITYLGCVDSSACTIFVKTVGVNNSTKNNIKIYPNPTNNIIYVQGLSDIENNIVELYDVQGNLMLSKEMLGNGMIDLAKFANGIYVIKIGGAFQRIAKM
jgi:hypothetical protein